MEQEYIDLFEHLETLPAEVQTIIHSYDDLEFTYERCEQMLKELRPLGYTFEYYLDAQPYHLQKLKEFEVFKNGTQEGTLFAKDLQEAEDMVFAAYGEFRSVSEREE
jgi:hypothetical protein